MVHPTGDITKTSLAKGPVTRCNFSCNLQRYSTLGRCKIGKYTFPSQFANIFLTYQTFVTNLHLLRVELRCKLPGKLHRVTGPKVRNESRMADNSFLQTKIFQKNLTN